MLTTNAIDGDVSRVQLHISDTVVMRSIKCHEVFVVYSFMHCSLSYKLKSNIWFGDI